MSVTIFGLTIDQILNMLAGIGAFTLIQNTLNSIFGHGSTASSDPMAYMAEMMNAMVTMQMIPMMMNMFKPQGGGANWLEILIPIAIVFVVLILVKKKGLI